MSNEEIPARDIRQNRLAVPVTIKIPGDVEMSEDCWQLRRRMEVLPESYASIDEKRSVVFCARPDGSECPKRIDKGIVTKRCFA